MSIRQFAVSEGDTCAYIKTQKDKAISDLQAEMRDRLADKDRLREMQLAQLREDKNKIISDLQAEMRDRLAEKDAEIARLKKRLLSA